MPELRTIQEVNEYIASCGCCAFDTCAEPRIDCQSITVDACGYTMLDIPDIVPLADRCKLYQTRTDSYVLSLSGSTTGTFGSREYSHSYSDNITDVTVRKHTYELDEDVRVCSEFQFSTNYDEVLDETLTFTDEEGGDAGSSGATYTSSSGVGVACSGTQTLTSYGDPPDISAWDFCSVTAHTPDEFWSYASGVFTLVDPDPLTPDVWIDGTLTLTVAFTDPVTVAMLETEIASRIALLDPEDPWGGAACSSSTEFDITYDEGEPVCEQVTSATKARYRVGVPDGYSTSVFECEWDEVFFPEDPEVLPTLVAARSWDYAGADEYSEWFEIDIPEEAGETRVVNMMVVCYRTKYGIKPTSSGEVYEFPE